MNIKAIIVAGIITAGCRMAWYTLGAQWWAAGWGVDLTYVQGVSVIPILVYLLLAWAYAWGFSYLSMRIDIVTFKEHLVLGIVTSAVFGVGSVLAVSISLRAHLTAIAIDAGYYLTQGLICATIIAIAKKGANQVKKSSQTIPKVANN